MFKMEEKDHEAASILRSLHGQNGLPKQGLTQEDNLNCGTLLPSIQDLIATIKRNEVPRQPAPAQLPPPHFSLQRRVSIESLSSASSGLSRAPSLSDSFSSVSPSPCMTPRTPHGMFLDASRKPSIASLTCPLPSISTLEENTIPGLEPMYFGAQKPSPPVPFVRVHYTAPKSSARAAARRKAAASAHPGVKKRKSPTRKDGEPHNNKPYKSEHVYWTMYQKLDFCRKWKEIEAEFPKAFPEESRRTQDGLNARYYRWREDIPIVDEHRNFIWGDPRQGPEFRHGYLTGKLTVREAEKSRKLLTFVEMYPHLIIKHDYHWVWPEHKEMARRLVDLRVRQRTDWESRQGGHSRPFL